VASECYKIDSKSIVADDLKAILKTALLKKEIISIFVFLISF